ncbi:MAG: hypothetical protein A2Z20_11870 [Bdellovibrionales bacterium RBG_16_40_8]|nr:MAG: hypothetical protein A2Z20_11870 [Bdellovibrionales bacterium RBG_16_40_8]
MKCYMSVDYMSKKKHNLLVVSHPDDETIFFGGLLLSENKRNWSVVCVTDANADKQGAKRLSEFHQATKKLGVKNLYFFHLPDLYEERLDINKIQQKLAQIPKPEEVYTHGPLGEYGHPHHQDVSFAVHQYFQQNSNKKTPVYSVAYNCMAEKVVKLTPAQYKKKVVILSQIYFSETERFMNFIPATAIECFTKLKFKEVAALYSYLTSDDNTDKNQRHLGVLEKYKWFMPYLDSFKIRLKNRLF